MAHVLRVHHRALNDQLQRIKSVLDSIDSDRPMVPLFVQFQGGLGDCLLAERSQVFPHVEFSQQDGRPALELHKLVRSIERSHAGSLVQLWKLLHMARSAVANGPAEELLAAELAALCDEYYQHLFEVECLLFPRLVSASSSGTQRTTVPTSVRVTT